MGKGWFCNVFFLTFQCPGRADGSRLEKELGAHGRPRPSAAFLFSL
jgi:hypothetical protein